VAWTLSGHEFGVCVSLSCAPPPPPPLSPPSNPSEQPNALTSRESSHEITKQSQSPSSSSIFVVSGVNECERPFHVVRSIVVDSKVAFISRRAMMMMDVDGWGCRAYRCSSNLLQRKKSSRRNRRNTSTSSRSSSSSSSNNISLLSESLKSSS